MAWTQLCVSVTTLALLAGSLAVPAQAGDRDDRDAAKQEILKAVERLLDEKLEAFKGELMRDIRQMLTRGAPKATDRRDGQPAPRLEVQPFPGRPGEATGRVLVRKHVQGPVQQERRAERNVQVLQEDGKVRVRLEADGKVLEKEFDLGDPEIETWMGKAMGECPCGRRQGPGEGMKAGRKPAGWGGMRILPFGGLPESGDGPALRERMRKELERWVPGQDRKPGAEGWRFLSPFGEGREGPGRRVEPKRVFEKKAGDGLERLEAEKNELKREIAEIKELLKQLAGKKRRRR